MFGTLHQKFLILFTLLICVYCVCSAPLIDHEVSLIKSNSTNGATDENELKHEGKFSVNAGCLRFGEICFVSKKYLQLKE
jgi:hypothetical protein